ncbi:DUF6153 family protein [Rhodococcus gannanensis]|uniref:DUF6153 family protein n=1 Tax=Rhodococcus gannanensis TaxID=1960308 RepID=A0ABW4P1J2_9NOCA
MPRSEHVSTGPRRAVLLLALALGVLAMHHVATSLPASAAHSPTQSVMQSNPAAPATDHSATPPADHGDGGDHSGGQHMLASCLAVLAGGVALLLVLLLFGVPAATGGPVARVRDFRMRAGRGPPFAPDTSTRLATLCLLRV